MTDDDRELDALWREKFGEPLPILGASEIVRRVLGLKPQKGPTKAA